MIAATPLARKRVGHEPHELFRQLLETYSQAVERAGVRIPPYRDAALPWFSKLSEESQRRVVDDVAGVLAVFEQLAAEGVSLKDTPKFLWRSLARLGMVPCSDIFGRIGDEDVVVIYSTEHRHIFQNLRFLELVNLTLEEVYCSEWYQYTRRPGWAQEALFKAAGSIFGGLVRETIDPGVARHLAEETFHTGEPPVRLWIKVKLLSPVTKDNRIAGLIAVNTCTHPLPGDELEVP